MDWVKDRLELGEEDIYDKRKDRIGGDFVRRKNLSEKANVNKKYQRKWLFQKLVMGTKLR